MDSVDVLVIGAGPAGLAAASAVSELGGTSIVVEQGANVGDRQRSDPRAQLMGVGGAGLYSDGKFSFRPSASRLWDLSPQELVDAGLQWLTRRLSSQSWVGAIDRQEPSDDRGAVIDKRYPSFYMSLEDRLELIDGLAIAVGPSLLTRTSVVSMRRNERGWAVDVDGARSGSFECSSVVVATGRLGPLRLLELVDGPWREGRLELGIRIEQPSETFFLASHPSTDPKLIARTPSGAEIRTFCCCRNGEVVPSILGDVMTVSGRADGPPTDQSNVALLIRPSTKDLATARAVLNVIFEQGATFVEPWSAFRNGDGAVAAALGSLRDDLLAGLEMILRELDVAAPTDAVVHAFAVEGVGGYPELGPSLEWGARDIWVAGDATGIFRGLTAAFVSGHFAGSAALGRGNHR